MPAGTPATLGRVVSLWRYPVKSMMGEELNASDVTERGLLGDRAYALVDSSNGRVASAKNPRKWAKLFDCRAALVEVPRAGERIPPVRIALPNSSSVTSERADLNQILSSELGREITLTATPPEAPSLEEYWPDIDGLAHRETVTDEAMALGAPAGTFFDFAAIHVLTTATLAKLQQLYPSGRFDARRFRPNLVVEPTSGEKDFVENAWVGHTLAIGDEVRLSVLIPCPRCVMTTLPQEDLPNDPGILRAAAQHNKVMIAPLGQAMPSVGVYAGVLRGGVVRRGDPCWLK
jgi:MOSC domain-containing protein